ncbi:MAG: ABC transporter permease, partial [Candidatus Eremiobacteraeota bacterium]|nr:ABC transporter permease [Candidatus Eremiobacteraeota bacterium]
MSTTGIIIRREYVERVKSRSFIIGTAFIVLSMFALALLPLGFRWLAAQYTSHIVVVAPTHAIGVQMAHAMGDYSVTISKDVSNGEKLPPDIAEQVTTKKYDGALVAYQTPKGLAFAFYPRQSGLLEKADKIRGELVPVAIGADLSGQGAAAANRAIDFPFKTVALNERYKSEQQEAAANVLVYVLLIILYTATIIYAVQVAQGVVEEKSNRVMEVLIAAVRPAQLLAGKIFGIGSVALTQMVIFALAAGAALILFGWVFVSTLSQADMAALARQAA